MNINELIPLVVSFGAALLTAWLLLRPVLAAQTSDMTADSSLELHSHYQQKDQVLQRLEDLEQDLVSKQLTAEEYAERKALLMSEAALWIERIEALQQEQERQKESANAGAG